MFDSSAVDAFEAYTNDYSNSKKVTSSLDFYSFDSPSDIIAPHPDLFEAEIEKSLAAFGPVSLQLLTVDPNDAYSRLRHDTPTCGPPSTLTVSSESAYDSLSTYSESFYNYPGSPYTSSTFPLDLEMDFQKFRVENVSEYGSSLDPATSLPTTVDPNSFGPLPPTPPRSPELLSSPPKAFDMPSSFSDYTPANGRHSSTPFNFHPQLQYSHTVSPTNVNSASRGMPSTPSSGESEPDRKSDTRRKFRCNSCTRAFARAYNLKTHMATHDPNRLKPFICSHPSCGRAFSRKHDLARHQISLHGTQKTGEKGSVNHSLYHPARKAIGVDKAARGWCESCGKGWVGRPTPCDCDRDDTDT